MLLSELKLPHLPVEQEAFASNPMPYIEAARREHPWLATIHAGYFIHGYQAVKDISIMDDTLRPSFDGVVDFYGAHGTPWAKYMHEMILAISGEKHTRIRESVAGAFTPRTVNGFRWLMRERISALLDEWAPKREFDFAEFAALFPISVLCGALGAPTDEIPKIQHALDTQSVVFSLDRDILPDLLDGYHVMWDFCDRLIKGREKEGLSGGTLLDSLIATKQAGHIDDTELRFLLMVLFPAGYDTSKNMLTLIVHMMLSHPDKWERCAADADYCAKVVEEMFRHTSTGTVFRTVAKAFEYGGVTFPKDTMLFFANSLAGRDPASFPDPMKFDPERVHTNRHVAFGRGAHICIGQHLARTQITEGLHLIAQRLQKPRLVGEVKWRDFMGTWGLRTLPLAFERGPAQPRQSAA